MKSHLRENRQPKHQRAKADKIARRHGTGRRRIEPGRWWTRWSPWLTGGVR